MGEDRQVKTELRTQETDREVPILSSVLLSKEGRQDVGEVAERAEAGGKGRQRKESRERH